MSRGPARHGGHHIYLTRDQSFLGDLEVPPCVTAPTRGAMGGRGVGRQKGEEKGEKGRGKGRDVSREKGEGEGEVSMQKEV